MNEMPNMILLHENVHSIPKNENVYSIPKIDLQCNKLYEFKILKLVEI